MDQSAPRRPSLSANLHEQLCPPAPVTPAPVASAQSAPVINITVAAGAVLVIGTYAAPKSDGGAA